MQYTFTKDRLRVYVHGGRAEMGLHAAKDAACMIRALLEEKQEVNLMVGAAPSQLETHAALCAEEGIDWGRVNAFHMDEYVGLDEKHPAGFRNFLRGSLFDRLPFKSVHLINGNADDPEAEARRYDALLRAHSLDVCILGIGENGHIAFNDPHEARFDDPVYVKTVTLDDVCRQQQVNDGCFGSLGEVPNMALTVTVPGLTCAKHLYCAVPASTKAWAVNRTLTGAVGKECPATVMRLHEDAALYLDELSSALLKKEELL